MISVHFRTVVIFLVGISVSVISQPRSGEREEREEIQVKRLQEKIGLTDDQIVKIKAIMKKAREEFKQKDGNRETRREVMMKRLEHMDTEITQLLSKEQKKKYEAWKKERRKEMDERRKYRE